MKIAFNKDWNKEIISKKLITLLLCMSDKVRQIWIFVGHMTCKYRLNRWIRFTCSLCGT
jgi:hypothetical protein